jgi:DNA-binding transcriptional ArsR family regulator
MCCKELSLMDQTMIDASAAAACTPAADDMSEEMAARADEAAAFLKALSHGGRLMILCHLVSGEKSVTELETLLGSRQAAVSQQLARLRLEGLVNTRREGKTIFYSLADPRSARLVTLVHELFCGGA